MLERLQDAAIVSAAAEKPPPEVAATTEVGQIFGGTQVSQLTCGECGRVSSTFEDFFDLSLELRRA
eukprot:5577215-Prymnesium_polylepis.1